MMRTLAGTVRVETRERGSRFIATAFPAGGAEEARAGIEAVRSELPDATHQCWAYILAGEARHLVSRHGGRVESAVYDDPRRWVLEALVPRAARALLENDLMPLTRGAAAVDEVAPRAPGPPAAPAKNPPA